MGSPKTLEAALELRDVAEENFKQMDEARDQHLQFERDLLAAHNVSCHFCCYH